MTTVPSSTFVSSRWVPFVVAGAYFMENLDATIITTALPQMALSFGVEPARISIGISAYMLALAVFIPMSGWLADRCGTRPTFAAAIVVFTIASLLCGVNENLWQFTAARILQGFGGAMMVPVGRLVVLRQTAKADLVKAIAMITWPGLAAPVIGPTVGALITTHLSWHWIFFVNIPLGIGALIAVLMMVENETAEPRPFDFTGFALSALGCSAVMVSLEFASLEPFDWRPVATSLAIGVALLVAAYTYLSRARNALIDVGALGITTFALSMRAGSLSRVAGGGLPFLLALLFQIGFGFSAITAGLLMLGLFAGTLAMKPATASIMRRFGFRKVLIVNGIIGVLGILVYVLFSASTPLFVIAAVLLCTGLSRSLHATCFNTIGYANVPSQQMSGATTIASMCQQMAAGMGVAYAAACLQLSSMWTGNAAPAVIDFQITFVFVAVLAVIVVLDTLRLAPDAGAEVSGHVR